MSTRDFPLRARLAPLRRRAVIVLFVIGLVTVTAYVTASARAKTYTAEAVMLVPSGARSGDPGRADEAAKLAGTYALAIPQDALVRKAVAQSLGVSETQARKHMSVANDANTAILRLRYSASSAGVATGGATAMVRAVLDRSVRTTIRPGSLALVRLPDPPTHNDLGTFKPILVGLICGIFLSIVLLVGLERSDPRVDDIDSLEKEATCPVSAVDRRSSDSLVAVLERWRQLIGERGGHVALLPCSPASLQHAREVALLLAGAGEENEVTVDLPLPSLRGNAVRAARSSEPARRKLGRVGAGGTDGALLVSVADAPGSEGGGESLALGSDLTVLIVAEGDRVADVRRAVASLEQFGVTPAWMFLVRPPARLHRRVPVAVGDAPRRVTDRGAAEA